MRGIVEVLASQWARTGHNGTPNPVHAYHVLECHTYPTLTLNLEGVGKIEMTPPEVRALLLAINDCVVASEYPGNYCNGRSCTKTL